jgi:hypothetical protein
MTWLLIKFGIRFLVFGGIFAFVAWKDERVTVQPKWALPLIGLVFAVMNTGLYWLLKPVLNLATLGAMGFLMPLVVNGLLLYATNRVLRPLQIKGIMPMFWLAVYLTAAHGALWLVLDKLV